MSKFTIMVCDHIHQSGLDLLAKATDVEMLNLANLPKDELKKELYKADIAITRSSTDVDESFLEAAKKLAEEMKDKEIRVSVKAGEGGRVFGSVSTKEIAEEIKKQLGYEIDKKKILLDAPVKALGYTEIGIKLHTKVTAKMRVHVVEG